MRPSTIPYNQIFANVGVNFRRAYRPHKRNTASDDGDSDDGSDDDSDEGACSGFIRTCQFKYGQYLCIWPVIWRDMDGSQVVLILLYTAGCPAKDRLNTLAICSLVRGPLQLLPRYWCCTRKLCIHLHLCLPHDAHSQDPRTWSSETFSHVFSRTEIDVFLLVQSAG